MGDFSDSDIDYTKVARCPKQMDYAGYLMVALADEKNTKVTRALEAALRRGTSQGTPQRVVPTRVGIGWWVSRRGSPE